MRLIDANKLMESLNPKESVWVGLVLSELIANAETVEAIPVEWLEMFMRRYKIEGGNEYALLHFMVTEWEKWEKENEHK